MYNGSNGKLLFPLYIFRDYEMAFYQEHHSCRKWLFLMKCSSLSLLLCSDVIWVILSVEVGGLLGVTQQLSSFQAEFNTQPHRPLEGDYNPFASPEKSKCPNSNSLHDAGGHRVQEERWQGSPSELQQDQNGLSHNSVDIVASSLQTNLSLVSYNKVGNLKGNFPNSWSIFPLFLTFL